MANALFDAAREAFLEGTLDWVPASNSIRLILVDHTDDTPNVASDDFLDDITGGARVATSGAFTTTTPSGTGVADGDDVTLSTVTGDAADSIVIYYHTGTESSSNLIVYIDTATGLPVTPNGGDIVIQWDAGANRIFKL